MIKLVLSKPVRQNGTTDYAGLVVSGTSLFRVNWEIGRGFMVEENLVARIMMNEWLNAHVDDPDWLEVNKNDKGTPEGLDKALKEKFAEGYVRRTDLEGVVA